MAASHTNALHKSNNHSRAFRCTSGRRICVGTSTRRVRHPIARARSSPRRNGLWPRDRRLLSRSLLHAVLRSRRTASRAQFQGAPTRIWPSGVARHRPAGHSRNGLRHILEFSCNYDEFILAPTKLEATKVSVGIKDEVGTMRRPLMIQVMDRRKVGCCKKTRFDLGDSVTTPSLLYLPDGKQEALAFQMAELDEHHHAPTRMTPAEQPRKVY